MNNYKINPEYALPEGLVIGMEGRFDDPVNQSICGIGVLIGYNAKQKYYVDDSYDRYKKFTPFQPWQPEPGELVWFEDGEYSDLGRFKGMSGDVYRILVNSRRSLRISVIAKVYDIDKEFGMTIKEIIDSRKPGDVLGVKYD